MLEAVGRAGHALAEALPEEVLRQRAERRVLRLFIHAPQCRELLSCLALQDPACRVALEWLSSLAVLAVDGALAPMTGRLAAEVPGAVGAVLAQAAGPGPELLAVLQRDPQGELQALLDVLEPVVLDQRSSATATGENQIGFVDPAQIRS